MDFAGSVRMSANEETQLAAILRCQTEELPGRIAELGKAAVREYLDMILSETVTRSPEVREHREPSRLCRRPFGLSYAAMAGSSSMA